MDISRSKGMTLIEVMVFAVLLSFLMAGFLRYAFIIHDQDIRLINDINDAQSS
jgi:type II secretory pathway pseudopilin PulG